MNSLWSQERYSFSQRNAYIVAFLLVGLASILRIGLLDILGSTYVYFTYYPAVIIAATIGGFFVGMMATTLTCLVVSLLWSLFVNEPFIKVPSDWLVMILFVINGILISSIAEARRRAICRANYEQKQLDFSLNISRQGYWSLNLENNLAEQSLLCAQIFGYARRLPTWTYETFLSHVHPDDRHFVNQHMRIALSNHNPWEIQCRIYRADTKALRWISASGAQIKMDKNNHMLGLVKDITEIKNTELALQKAMLELDALLEATPDSLVICNRKGDITYVNNRTTKIFGYEKKELLGKKIETLIPDRFNVNAQHEKQREVYFKKPYIRPIGIGLDLFGKHKDGHDIPVEINLNPMETKDGVYALAAVRDISERKQLQKLLSESEARWKYALESANQGVWDWFVPEKIIYFSTAWKTMLGYQEDDIKNEQQEFESRVHPDDLVKVWARVKEHFDQKTKEYICEARFRCKDGSYKWVLDRGKVISRDSNGNVLRAIGTHTDINELKEQELKLKNLAEHDALTGLINRPFFEDRIEQAISLAKRQQDNIAVCFLDIDHFKQINDSYGHAIGDLLLCAVTKRIQTCIRNVDTLARLGGDEFALILLDVKKEQDVIKIIKKIVRSFSEGFVIENKTIKVTVSIGISLYPRDGEQSLIKKADSAMYYVKQHGKNNFKLFGDS